MNDIILTSLLNLFALFDSDRSNENSQKILSKYLTYHFGLKDIQTPLDFYRSMLDYYESQTEIDRNTLCGEVASQIKNRVTAKERILIVLRFMEIRSSNGTIEKNELKTVADAFDITPHFFEQLYTFVATDADSDHIKSLKYGDGIIRTLFLKDYDTILFSYHGSDPIRYNNIPLANGSFLTWERSGVVQLHGERPLYYFNAKAAYLPTETPTTQLKLRGNEVDFRYDKGNVGIHNFTFTLYGGELVAILGGSGTGKTTLLSLLNGTLHPQKGEVTINGHSIDEPEVKKLIGNVPQDDLLIGDLTVYQNLYYTARLCFDDQSEEVINNKVLAMLQDMGLTTAKDLKVGSPIDKYISGGQRKRLNIAMELIREPNVLFLDEPTSGLSSFDSMAVMTLLREQVFKGKLIIVNIHQPSSEIFKMFDRLWILDVGGYPIYNGNPIEALTYFKQAAGYADDQTSVCPMCGNVDSETILSIIGEKVIDNNGQISNKRKWSPQDWHNLYLKTAAKSKDKVEELPTTAQKRPSSLKQMWIYFVRNFKAKLADKQWLLISLLEAPTLALVCAILTHYTTTSGYTLMDNKNFVSYLFMAVIVVTFMGMSGSAEEIIKDRAILKREKFLGLSYASYIWSKILFMAVISIIQTLLFIVVGNSIIGLHCLFWKWFLLLFITSLLASLIGLLLSQRMKSVVAIYITIPILLIPQILLCGLVVNFPDLTPKSHTANVPTIGDVIPSRWAFEALAVSTFSDNDYEKHFFANDQRKYEAQYYENAYLYELRSQLETMENKNKKGESSEDNLYVIKKSLPLLLAKADLKPYNGSYTYLELNNLFDSIEKLLSQRSQMANRENEKIVKDMLAHVGQDEIVRIKRDNFNLQLERQVVNSETEKMYKIVDGYIVPQAGFIYLDPVTRNGRSPFFSSCKIIGQMKIKTFWFNIAVLLLMCSICTVSLLVVSPEGKKFKH